MAGKTRSLPVFPLWLWPIAVFHRRCRCRRRRCNRPFLVPLPVVVFFSPAHHTSLAHFIFLPSLVVVLFARFPFFPFSTLFAPVSRTSKPSSSRLPGPCDRRLILLPRSSLSVFLSSLTRFVIFALPFHCFLFFFILPRKQRYTQLLRLSAGIPTHSLVFRSLWSLPKCSLFFLPSLSVNPLIHILFRPYTQQAQPYSSPPSPSLTRSTTSSSPDSDPFHALCCRARNTRFAIVSYSATAINYLDSYPSSLFRALIYLCIQFRSPKMVSILRVAGLVVLAGTTIVDAADSSDSFKPEPNVPGPFRALEYFGCFKDATPMKDEGMYKFMTSGLCQKVCYQAKSAVMGMTDGYSCWCGANLPAEDTAVANDTCSTSCPGYPQEKCTYFRYHLVLSCLYPC